MHRERAGRVVTGGIIYAGVRPGLLGVLADRGVRRIDGNSRAVEPVPMPDEPDE
jgi:hypothetical protein